MGIHCIPIFPRFLPRADLSANYCLRLGSSEELGKVIQPAFIGLSGTVLTVNLIVGGSLTLVSGLVNGLLLAIAAGILYLGKLASDDQREKAGGPMGPVTLNLSKALAVLLKILGGGSVEDSEQVDLPDWMSLMEGSQ